MDESGARAFLLQCFRAAVAAADPAVTLAQHLPEPPKGRLVIVGAGKSAAAMARATERAYAGHPLSGVVVTRYGHAVPTERIEVLQAAHPVPDANSEIAAQRILAAVRDLGPDDLVVALISGGGSALMALPVAGLTLDQKAEVNRRLLASGLPIGVMNALRRRLSAIKGGKLARAAAPARVVTLAISDVPGDAPDAIASGPTVPDPDPARDLTAAVAALGADLPDPVRRALLQVPGPAMAGQAPADFRLIASPMQALEAAAGMARAQGVAPLILGDAFEGESAALGRVLADMARSAARFGHPVRRPALLLSGGETTVTLGAAGGGRGGRNTECALALALALDGLAGVHAIACDTDGIDGTEDAAGAIVAPDTLARAEGLGLSAADHLRRHDSYGFFAGLGDLVITGPTLTNVNDFRAVLIH